MKSLVIALILAGLTSAAWSQTPPPEWSGQDGAHKIEQAIAEGAPTETVGVEIEVLENIALDHLGNIGKGSSLRARKITLQPGARIAVHRHTTRPTVVYVISGEVFEYRNDSDEPQLRRAGDSFTEGPGLVHWVENVSCEPATAFAVDIYSEE